MAFTFNNKLNLTIENHNFQVDTTKNDIVLAVQRIQVISEELNNETKPVEEKVSKFNDELTAFIKTVLGDEAMNTLFEGRVISFVDLAELCIYILTEIEKFKTDKLTRFNFGNV